MPYSNPQNKYLVIQSEIKGSKPSRKYSLSTKPSLLFANSLIGFPFYLLIASAKMTKKIYNISNFNFMWVGWDSNPRHSP